MEYFYHSDGEEKNLKTLYDLLSMGLPVELDFVMTNDGVLVWTHDIMPTNFLNSESNSIKEFITLEQVLRFNENYGNKLLLDIKYIPGKYLNSKGFENTLRQLNDYGKISIESLDMRLINKLLNGDFPNIHVGLIINVLSKGYVNPLGIPNLINLDFMAISYELWERNNGAYIKNCNSLYPDIKKYGWKWGKNETPEKDALIKFIKYGADGIVTNRHKMLLDLLNEQYPQRKRY